MRRALIIVLAAILVTTCALQVLALTESAVFSSGDYGSSSSHTIISGGYKFSAGESYIDQGGASLWLGTQYIFDQDG